MVLVRRPMPGITMEQLLLPVLPSIKKKQPLSLANKVSLSTCKKSVVPLFWSTRSSKGRQMNSEHLLFCFVVIGFVFVTLNLRFVCGPCRIYQIPMSCIHPQTEMPVLSAPRQTGSLSPGLVSSASLGGGDSAAVSFCAYLGSREKPDHRVTTVSCQPVAATSLEQLVAIALLNQVSSPLQLV